MARRFLVLFVFFEDGHRCRARFGDPFDGTQFFTYKMQGVVVAVGFEENCEVPISEETVRGFDYNALHWPIGHLRESVPAFSSFPRAQLNQN